MKFAPPWKRSKLQKCSGRVALALNWDHIGVTGTKPGQNQIIIQKHTLSLPPCQKFRPPFFSHKITCVNLIWKLKWEYRSFVTFIRLSIYRRFGSLSWPNFGSVYADVRVYTHSYAQPKRGDRCKTKNCNWTQQLLVIIINFVHVNSSTYV